MLSKKTRYALVALVRLTKEYGKGPVLIADIAKDQVIPQKFLESILLDLKKMGILGSKSGKSGGYYLIKDPQSVDILSVIRTMDGPVALVPCVSEKYYQSCEFCKEEDKCGLRNIFKDIRDYTYQKLKDTSLIDIMDVE